MIDYSKALSPRVLDIKPSGIRRFFDLAAEMEGVISLGVGEPDFETPWAIRKAAIRSLEKGHTFYSSNAGMQPLKQEIADYLHRSIHVDYDAKDEVLVTVGGSEAIDLLIRAVVSPGDEVMIPEPCFVSYAPIVSLCGGVPIPIDTKAEDGFRLTAAALRQHMSERSKLLVFPFPSNPTGAVMRRGHLEEIAAVLRDTNIVVLSDEIYAELTYGDEPHVSIAEMAGMRERTVIVSGFSKAFAMTGWRLGYAAGPRDLMEQMLKIHQFGIMCAPTMSQYAGIEALRHCAEDIAHMREQYDLRRKLMVSSLNALGLSCFEAEGAFYLFPSIQSTGLSSEAFCEQLLQSQKIAVVPGNAFGASGEGFVRISYSYSIQHLTEALRRIEAFLQGLR